MLNFYKTYLIRWVCSEKKIYISEVDRILWIKNKIYKSSSF